MFCNNLTNRGKKILRELGVSEEDIDNYLVMLTTPAKPSLLKIEDDELMQIAIQVQKDNQQFKLFKELFVKFKEEDVKKFGLYTHSPEYEKKFEEIVKDMKKQIRPEILDALQKHYAKYFYTKFLFTEERGVYSFEHYLKTLVRLVNSDADLKAAFEKQEKEFQEAVGERENLIKKLKLKKDLIEFFDAWGDFMVTKIYRRYAQLFAIYKMVPIIEEIGRRIGLTIKQTKFMTSEEIERALFGGAFNAEEVKGRVKFSVYYADKNEHTFYSGDEAKRAAELVQTQDIEQVDEIKGQCGCQGEARGIVKIINVVEDMQKMKKGDILVSISTQPDLVPAMKRAAAFVTEQGGVTSHAAIVARELKIPCVIGTKIATRVLKDGDEVEVDATHGTVKIIKKA
ncbi:hypothetical protein KJ969_01705 [Patescibacteria group bacterium]|nr:hypothetical protein [Patescibacteria group bacterium]MBU1922546.1 hypothetical protein [Patescibacteria group bacterium]